MDIRLEYIGKTLVVKLYGELDQSCASDIREKIDKEITLHSMKNLVMDFNNVEFMDSSGIGLIMGRYKLMKFLKGSLELVNVPQRIDRLIKLSGLYILKR